MSDLAEKWKTSEHAAILVKRGDDYHLLTSYQYPSKGSLFKMETTIHNALHQWREYHAYHNEVLVLGAVRFQRDGAFEITQLF